MKMNILFICKLPFTPFSGGIERFSLEIGKQFESDGNKVYYLSQSRDSQNGLENPFVFKQYFFPNVSDICGKENLNYTLSIVEKYNIDILFNQQGDSLPFTQLCHAVKCCSDAKLVSILHFSPLHILNNYKASISDILSSGLSFRNKLLFSLKNSCITKQLILHRKTKLLQKSYNQMYDMSDAFVLLSDYFRKDFIRITNIDNADKLFSVPNPLTTINKTDVPSSTKENILLFVGRLTFEQKRPDLVIKIWKKLYKDYPDWKFIILGDGYYRSSLEWLINKESLERIELVGYKNSMDYYRKVKILCVTSNTEGCPLVIQEAANNHIPALSFDSYSSVHQVIQDGKTGYIIPPFFVDEYVEKLRILMSNDQQLKKMSENAYHYSQTFTIDKIAQKWYDLFHKIVINR